MAECGRSYGCSAATVAGCTVVLDLDRVQCESDDDCVALTGESAVECSAGYCVEEQGEACSEHSDCAADEFCHAGVCEQGCRDADVCELGQTCVSGKCSGEADPNWACFDRNAEAGILAQAITIKIAVENVFQMPVTDATVKLCQGFDTACKSPVETYTSVGGEIEVEISGNNSWYLVASHPDFDSIIYMIPGWLTEDTTLSPLPMAPSDVRTSLFTATGATLVEGRGEVSAVLVDCTGAPAGGIKVTSSRQDEQTSTAYYPFGGEETATTSVGGSAVLINHPPGLASIELVIERTGQHLATAPVNVFSDLSALVTLGLTPTGRQ